MIVDDYEDHGDAVTWVLALEARFDIVRRAQAGWIAQAERVTRVFAPFSNRARLAASGQPERATERISPLVPTGTPTRRRFGDVAYTEGS